VFSAAPRWACRTGPDSTDREVEPRPRPSICADNGLSARRYGVEFDRTSARDARNGERPQPVSKPHDLGEDADLDAQIRTKRIRTAPGTPS
jgi:hypothetical protein